MSTALTAERVRTDIEVISRAGLPVDEFLDEAAAAVRRAVPWGAACIGMHDPATRMLTSARKFGALAEIDSLEPLFARLEYGGEESTSFEMIADREVPAVGMHASRKTTEGASPRMDQLVRPFFGFSDELRVVFRDELGMWGGTAFFREAGDAPFSDDDIAFVATLSGAFARGIRGGVLAEVGSAALVDADADGPAVVIVDRDDEVRQISVDAQRRLAQLGAASRATDPIGMVLSLVMAARRVPNTPGARVPRARVRTPSGLWLVLHASPLVGPDGMSGDVVVTIEEARPTDVVDLLVAAFGLTGRERDVTRLVLQGAETKQIASTLHVSAYTVQDHLKSVFDKAGVRSRRELIARVYVDQYAPRLNQPVAPSGWFIG